MEETAIFSFPTGEPKILAPQETRQRSEEVVVEKTNFDLYSMNYLQM
jgi:hypothetical protein